MIGRSDSKADSGVLVFSMLAVLVAATLTMATITTNVDKNSSASEIDLATPDPLKRADMAAKAGVEAAKYHIECHGRTEAGRISPRFYINGATYVVEWDDVNMADSTANVKSTGDFSWGGDKHYRVEVNSKVKLSFFPAHKQEILSAYYSRDEVPFKTALK